MLVSCVPFVLLLCLSLESRVEGMQGSGDAIKRDIRGRLESLETAIKKTSQETYDLLRLCNPFPKEGAVCVDRRSWDSLQTLTYLSRISDLQQEQKRETRAFIRNPKLHNTEEYRNFSASSSVIGMWELLEREDLMMQMQPAVTSPDLAHLITRILFDVEPIKNIFGSPADVVPRCTVLARAFGESSRSPDKRGPSVIVTIQGVPHTKSLYEVLFRIHAFLKANDQKSRNPRKHRIRNLYALAPDGDLHWHVPNPFKRQISEFVSFGLVSFQYADSPAPLIAS